MQKFSRVDFFRYLTALLSGIWWGSGGQSKGLFGPYSAGAAPQKRRQQAKNRPKNDRKKPHGKRPSKRRSSRKPDVVLIVFDDMRDDEWQFLRKTRSTLRRLGTIYRNYLCENPVCGPDRGSLLTGRASHNSGVASNKHAARGIKGRSLPQALRKVGYTTGLVGKYLNGSGARKPAGWDFFNDTGRKSKHFKGQYLDDYYADEAVRFLRENPPDHPRFLYLAFHSPHEPFIAEKKHRGKFKRFFRRFTPAFNEADVSDKPQHIRDLPRVSKGRMNTISRTRGRMLLSTDEAIMKVFKELKKQKRFRSAVIIVVSDNGYMFGDHRITTKGVPYDASLRVSMMAKGPRIPRQRTSDRLVAVQDVATTIANITGANLKRPDGHDFRSGNSDFKFCQYHGRNPWYALRGRTWLYVEYPGGEREYYDYTTDPYELNNQLANWSASMPADAEHPEAWTIVHTPQLPQERQIELAAQLAKVKRCRGKTCP